ncbi:unnamed protein product [Peronospora belbahrii]|uniref:Uncharacterized protein n=1 Tax=Peronospora belbahrii TaxID=622444 RepID=A0AAU9L2B2_9STRA|nr:unnamed protein product [Peronospora belbahrii]
MAEEAQNEEMCKNCWKWSEMSGKNHRTVTILCPIMNCSQGRFVAKTGATCFKNGFFTLCIGVEAAKVTFLLAWIKAPTAIGKSSSPLTALTSALQAYLNCEAKGNSRRSFAQSPSTVEAAAFTAEATPFECSTYRQTSWTSEQCESRYPYPTECIAAHKSRF